MANIYALADRWHMTPAQVRREVTIEDLAHVVARDKIESERAQ